MNFLLDLISRKLKIDAHYLYKGFFWIGIATVVVVVVNLIKSIFFANFISQQTYGNYRYVLSIIEIASALSLSGATAVIARSVAQGYEGTYKKGLSEYLKSSWISVLITCVICIYFILRENPILGLSIGIAGILAPLLRTVTLYGSFLEGKKQFSLNAKYQIFSVTLPALILIYAITSTQSILIIITVYFLSYIVVHSLITFLILKQLKPNNRVDPKSKSFTFHLSLIGALATLSEQIDKILLFHFVGSAQLALYSFAAALPEQFNILGKALRSLINPNISNHSIISIKKNILYRAIIIFGVCLLMFFSYVILAPYIFYYFFNPYIEAVLLSQVYALSIFLIIGVPYKLALLAHNRTREIYFSKITAVIFRLTLLALLIYYFGIWGVVAAFLISRFVEMFLFIYFVHFGLKESSSNHPVVYDGLINED